jgi:hypothetical protein
MAVEPWYSRVKRHSSTLFDVGAVVLTLLWLFHSQGGVDALLKIWLLLERGSRLVLTAFSNRKAA